MIFELNNNDRKYLGLNQLQNDLSRLDINNNCSIFIDSNNNIKKVMYIIESEYYENKYSFNEFDTFYKLDELKNILPNNIYFCVLSEIHLSMFLRLYLILF